MKDEKYPIHVEHKMPAGLRKALKKKNKKISIDKSFSAARNAIAADGGKMREHYKICGGCAYCD